MADRLRHLRKIENLFKQHPKKEFSKTEIRDILNIDYNTVLNALTYLLDKKVIKLKKGEVDKYKLR